MGPALFLAGQVLFKRALLGVLSVARLVAIAALVALVPLGWVVSSLRLATMATLVLAAVAGGTRESSIRTCPSTNPLIRPARPVTDSRRPVRGSRPRAPQASVGWRPGEDGWR